MSIRPSGYYSDAVEGLIREGYFGRVNPTPVRFNGTQNLSLNL